MEQNIQAMVMTFGALFLGGIALFWYWSRMRGGSSSSANDYVEISKAQAQAQLKDIINQETRRS